METKNTQEVKAVSALNWFEMKAEATKRGLKTKGVSKQDLAVALQKARNAEKLVQENMVGNVFKRQQPGPSTGNTHPDDKKAIAEAIERPKHVVVSKDVADVLGAKAIEKKPALSEKAEKNLKEGKYSKKQNHQSTLPKYPNGNAGDSKEPRVKQNRTPVLSDDPTIKKIQDLDCKVHIKIYKLSQLNISNKLIAEFLGTNPGHVWNVKKKYSESPEKVTEANLL
jgi:hypothetical protein